MPGIVYFALKRLSTYDGGEPLVLDAGTIIPAHLVEGWGARGVSSALESHKIAPLPAAVADLLAPAKPRRVKAAA